MLTRRRAIVIAAATVASPAVAATHSSHAPHPAAPKPAPQDSFSLFVASVRAEALRSGISRQTLDRAFAGVQPNQRVIELDRKQPEFTWTWEQYRSRVVSQSRVAKGREKYDRNRDLLARVASRYGVPASVIMGIWGLESDYGAEMGGFHVIEALATLSWEGRRAQFFRSELMDALRILQAGDIAPSQMVGSYAGAMGQTQFMPDSFLKYAVDFSGTGRRDIWNDLGCVFASTANYLAREGWQSGLPWGCPVQLPATFDAASAGRQNRRRLREWLDKGVRLKPGVPVPPDDSQAAVILPGGAEGEAYLAYHPNFLALRRYNPSDFYCISVGLIGDLVTA